MALPERDCRNRSGIGAQDARTKADAGHEGKGAQLLPFCIGPAALGTDENGPRSLRQARKGFGGAGKGLVGPKDAANRVPAGQQLLQRHEIAYRRHEGTSALLGGLDRMGLQTVLTDALGVGALGLDGQNARGAHLGRFLDDEIGARFLDRRKDQPQIGRIALRRALGHGDQLAVALAEPLDAGQPFAVLAVEDQNFVTRTLPHDAVKIMGLIGIKGYALSCAKRVIYEQPDFCHGGNLMQTSGQIPEAVADAPKDNWVDLYAPEAWRPWLRLSRADRPIGTWLLLLPCFFGLGLAMMATAPRWFDLWIVIACTIGAFVMRGAGCTWNDITDRHIDGSVARTRSRPIPSGQVTVTGAVVWMIAQCLIGLVILLTLGKAAIILGVVSLVPVAVYPFAKRFTWWPQVFLGVAFNWGALLAWAAHTGNLAPAPVIAWIAGICWTVFYDTIYAHQDAEDDALIGVKSTALFFGEDSPRWLLGFAIATVILVALAVLAVGPSGLSAVLAWLGLAGFAAHLGWQLLRFDQYDGALCLKLFRSNRDAGLVLAVLFGLAGLA